LAKQNRGAAGTLYWEIPVPEVREGKTMYKLSRIKNKMLLH